MAKFPTEVERSVTVKVPRALAYAFLWDVVASSSCIPGMERCKRAGKDTYCFEFKERSAGPISLRVQYTAKYHGNGVDEIDFESTSAKDDNTDVTGRIRFKAVGADSTRIVLWQRLAPDTPVPTLLQGFVRSSVEKEAGEAVRQYLAAVKKELEAEA